jgi:membrane-bound serine protease (ClpP class)
MFRKLMFLLLLPLLFVSAVRAAEPAAKPDRRLFTGENRGGKVYFVPQFTEFKEVSEQDLLFLRKVIKRAEEDNAKAIIFELDTPGGRVDVALRYLSVFAKSEVPIVAYLNPQGISAGMIIALAADRIAISHHGVIGDAMPLQMGLDGARPVVAPPEKEEETPPTVEPAEKPATAEKAAPTAEPAPEKPAASEKTAPAAEPAEKPAAPPADQTKEKKNPDRPEPWAPLVEEIKKLVEKQSEDTPETDELKRLADQKFLTVFFKILQVLAEKNDRPVKVIRATADPYVKLTKAQDGIDHAGRSPLTLSAKEAKELGVVDYVVRNRADILEAIGLPDAELKIIEPDGLEQIFHFLSHPGLAMLLIAVGIIGIFVEAHTPGFGVPGTLGIAAIVLYFLGQVGSGGSDWGPMVVFFVGIVLLALEIFLIPGFGVVGLLGGICIIGSLVAAVGFDDLETATQVVGGGLLVAILGIALLVIYVLPNSTIFRRVSLAESIGQDPGAEATAADAQLGKIGVALTALRPAGVIVIGDKRFDATTEGGFIEAGTPIEVVGKKNFQLVAQALKKTAGTES